MQNYSYSEAGLQLTMRYEGLRLEAYQDQGGIWTIGYGHTGVDVVAGREIMLLEAEALLRVDLRSAVRCVNAAVTAPLQQNQFDALVDFCFNVGPGSFMRSTLLKRLNARDYPGTADQFGRWTRVDGQPCRGLQRRRSAETAMFLGSYRANSIA